MARVRRCRHRDSWLLAGGTYEWCYRCGALRRMREAGIAEVVPMSPWLKPVGPAGGNPWEKWKLRTANYLARRAEKGRRR